MKTPEQKSGVWATGCLLPRPAIHSPFLPDQGQGTWGRGFWTWPQLPPPHRGFMLVALQRTESEIVFRNRSCTGAQTAHSNSDSETGENRGMQSMKPLPEEKHFCIGCRNEQMFSNSDFKVRKKSGSNSNSDETHDSTP